MIRTTKIAMSVAAMAMVSGGVTLHAQEKKEDLPNPKVGVTIEQLPAIPGSDYKVFDGNRPQPPQVEPGEPSTQEEVGSAPSDATVLFDGSNLDAWHDGAGGECHWKLEDGVMIAGKKEFLDENGEKQSRGSIYTREEFGDMQLHLEWRIPEGTKSDEQKGSNSGVILMNRYEIQVLDCYENRTYPDGMTGAMYGQWPPMVNATAPTGEWNMYDIIFEAPEFAEDGSVEEPAYVTVIHNGVLLHHRQPFEGGVVWKAYPQYSAHPPKGPIQLQYHNDPLQFRNVWVRDIPGYDSAAE